MLLSAELLRDSHLTVEAEVTLTAPTSKMPVKPTAPSKAPVTSTVPKRVNGKKVAPQKEQEFKVQRPWGGFHTSA